jgi:hypothetical protein
MRSHLTRLRHVASATSVQLIVSLGLIALSLWLSLV